MAIPRFFAALALASLCAFPAAADTCRLDLGTRGTFHEVSGSPNRCLRFVDVLGNAYEVTNPKGSWLDGTSGVVFAQLETQNQCTADPPIRICTFEGDYAKHVSGTLILLNFVECPGYVIRTSSQDYRIDNCEAFGAELCNSANLGKKIQADVFVTAEISICLSLAKTTVLDFRFQ